MCWMSWREKGGEAFDDCDDGDDDLYLCGLERGVFSFPMLWLFLSFSLSLSLQHCRSNDTGIFRQIWKMLHEIDGLFAKMRAYFESSEPL